jgi:hypothetical protein
MYIPQTITGIVFNFSEAGENEIFTIAILPEFIHTHKLMPSE